MPESLPLADTHVHLLAGLDDGPRDSDEALTLCRQLVSEGVRIATALAHQNQTYPDVTPQRITEATTQLMKQLAEKQIPLSVCPSGEVVLTDDLVTRWTNNELQSVGGGKKYLLVEMPHRAFIDPRPAAVALRKLGIRLIIAHAERYEPLLHDPGFTEQCIVAGCLIQVTTDAFTMASDRELAALREWGTRGMIHLLGSDGHRVDYRRPQWKEGFRIFQRMVGAPAAEKVASIWGSAVLQGLNVNPPPPKPKQKSWFGKMFGS